MGIPKVLRRSFATIAVAALVLSACGGDDDDDAAGAATATVQPATTEAAADDSGDNTADTGDENNGTVQVDSLKDIPQECLDIFGDYLKQIEPVVKDVDWSNADASTLQTVGEQLGTVGSSMDDDMKAAGCDKYNLSGDVDMDELIDIAKDKAPGTVAYFEFLKQLSEGFSNLGTTPPTTSG